MELFAGKESHLRCRRWLPWAAGRGYRTAWQSWVSKDRHECFTKSQQIATWSNEGEHQLHVPHKDRLWAKYITKGAYFWKRWSSITNWSRAALYLTMANQRKNFDGKIAMNLNFAAEGLAQKLNIKINKYCICLREEKVTWVVSTVPGG